MSGGTYTRKTVDVTEVHSNVDQRIIQITEDKIKLILKGHLENLENKKAWIAPLGILVTLLAVFCTTDFKKAFFSADTWQAFFVMATILTVAWLVRAFYCLSRAESLDDIVEKIKRGEC